MKLCFSFKMYMKVTCLWICAEVSCTTQEHLLEMSLCGITHEAPGSRHTPATRAQMAAKQANYFKTPIRRTNTAGPLWHSARVSRHY